MATIREVMTKEPAVVGTRSALSDALALMQERKVHHLPVVDLKGAPIGVISQRDIILGMGLRQGSIGLVEDVMTPNPLVVSEDAFLEEIVAEMRKRKFNAAIVVDAIGRVNGIFTITDVLSVLASLTKKMA